MYNQTIIYAKVYYSNICMTHEVGYGVEETPPRLFSEVAGIQDGLYGSEGHLSSREAD